MSAMDMDTSAPPTPAEPVLIDAGPQFDEFAKLLDKCLSSKGQPDEKRQLLLDLPRKYHDITVNRLRRLQPRARNGDVDMMNEDEEDAEVSQEEANECKRLSKEAQTWDLLSRVLPLRHPAPVDQQKRLREVARGEDDNGLLKQFFRNDRDAQERRVVLQWLQTNATSRPSIDDLTRDLQQSADRGDIVAHGWVHTRSEIKYKKSVTGWPHLLDRQQSTKTLETHNTSKDEPMITQLDPDACSRQGRQLQPQDAFFEKAIWLGCFEHLRRGSTMKQIRDWCSERTETWRAISMSGMLLSTDDEDITDCSSPASLALWRRMCYSLAQNGTSDEYAAAVYGLLSGDIATVEKVAKTWEDFLFTHYNALLRAQIDSYILAKCPPAESASMVQSFPIFNAITQPMFGGHQETSVLQQIAQKEGPKNELLEPNKALQSAFLSWKLDEYFVGQGDALLHAAGSQESGGHFKSEDYDGLRVVTHVWALATVLQAFELQQPSYEALANSPRWLKQSVIVSQYAVFLRMANLQELIPTYCSLLPAPQRYQLLSANLILEEDNGRRRDLLALMQKAGIDVVEYVENQAGYYYDKVVEAQEKQTGETPVFRCLSDGSSSQRIGRGMKADFFGEDEDDVEPNHEYLVRSIDWLKLVSATWPGIFSWGSAAYKTFLKNVDLRSARLLMTTLSFSSIITNCLNSSVDDDEPFDLAFWSSHIDTFDDPEITPHEVMEHARTFRELEALVIALDNLETISAFAEFATEIEDKPVPEQKKFWDQVKETMTATKDSMAPLLQAWLITGIQSGDKQLQHIRDTYLPETILAYVSALHFAGTGLSRDWLLESMHLATLIAEKDSDLEATFVKAKRVKELLEAFAASSKALAIATGEKRASGHSSKKLRELGWSRDLWAVKS